MFEYLPDVLKGPVIHHCINQGMASIRDREWKLIPGTKELFNLRYDLAELNNLYDKKPLRVADLSEKFDQITKMVNAREKASENGSVKNHCF